MSSIFSLSYTFQYFNSLITIESISFNCLQVFSVMENYYLDLNLDWDADEFVPSTQFTENPSIAAMNSSQTNASPYVTHAMSCSPQIHAEPDYCFSSQPIAMRTPLSPISNNTPCPAAPSKKATKSSKERKASVASSKNKHLIDANATLISNPQHVPPRNTQAPSFSSEPSPSSTNTALKPDGDKSIPSKLFFWSGHWTLKETVTLLDARVKLLEEMKEGNLGAVLKTQDERWEYISKYCVQRGALRSPDQCLFRWDRILAAFKKIHDYERHIPSGKDSYWAMSSKERDEMKLPRSFGQDIYGAMLDRIGSERLINPGNIIYDTSNDTLGELLLFVSLSLWLFSI